MSRMLALAVTATLLCLTACVGTTKNTAQPAAEKTTQPANAATTTATEDALPKMVDVPAVAAEKHESSVNPADANLKADAASGARLNAPAIKVPAAKQEARVVQAGALTKEQALALAGKGNCLACHKIEGKVVGPAWKDVGAKYKADANAASTIATHIKVGGSFGWKMGAMPPRGGSTLSDADVASLAKFIAALK